jgi:hypothetical protein
VLRSRTLIVALALVLALASGCVRSVAARGTGWWRVTTDHVELATDVDRERAVTAGWAFEDLYRALEHVFPECAAPPITERVSVTMFAQPREYDALAPADTSGFFRPARTGIVGTSPALVVRSGSGISQGYFTQIYVHELTHRFVARCMPAAPRWLDEGLARYFETLRVGESDVVLGVSPYQITARGAPSWRFRAGGIEILQLGRDHLRLPSELMTLALADFYASARVTENYAGAWALVHMLTHGPSTDLRSRFTRYLAALPEEGSDETLFETTFGDVSLDAEVARYLDRPLLERHVRYDPAPLADPPAEELPPGEAHLFLAALLSSRGDPEFRREALEHVALAASDPRARSRAALLALQLGEVEPTETKASRLATLAAEYPDDVHVLSARAVFEVSRQAPTNEGQLLLDLLSARGDLGAIDFARARATALTATSRRHEAEREVRLGWITGGHAAPPSSVFAGFGEVSSVDAAVTDPPPFALDAIARTALPLPESGVLLALTGATRASYRASALSSECAGFVGEPFAVLEIEPGTPPLVFRTLGDRDMVLLVEDAAHHILCDDDSGGGTNAAILLPAEHPGPLVIRVGAFRPEAAPVPFELVIQRAEGRLDPRTAAQPCGFRAPTYGPVHVGMEVVLGRHHAWPAPADTTADVIRDESWVPAMSAFVGRHARITALGALDAAGCTVVRVDADEGHWLWRVRDLGAP